MEPVSVSVSASAVGYSLAAASALGWEPALD
jgi:hypothetical protein